MTSTQPSAPNTGTLWDAVGGKPLGDVLPRMRKEGWTQESSTEGDVFTIVMARDNKRLTLYVSGGRVGMVKLTRP